MSKLTFSKSLKQLRWGTDTFEAISGGFGKGPLPAGSYTIRVRHVVVNAAGSGYKDPLTGSSWFIPLEPKFNTSRGGFGIHPDGKPKGTKGCIGLQGKDTAKFWGKWKKIALESRPKELVVKD